MSNLDTMLRAVKENPEDDAVRLVFADWLEDHPEADAGRSGKRSRRADPSPALTWADAIRRQVALVRSAPTDPEYWDRWDYSQKRKNPEMAVATLLSAALEKAATWKRFAAGVTMTSWLVHPRD